MIRIACVALGVVITPGLATAQEAAIRDPAAGCYRIELGAWTPALQQGNARYQIPPSAFVLDTVIGTNMFERGKGIVRPTIPHGYTPSAAWERISPDSIRIIWTNGFAGARLRLLVDGGSLSGKAQAFTDEVGGPPDPVADVEGRRIECSELRGGAETAFGITDRRQIG